MIINFSVQNFGSIKEKQTLSFEAEKSAHLESQYVVTVSKRLRILKMALIYGANASGKTTVLKALDFLRDLVLRPLAQKNATLAFEPFLFDSQTPDKNTFLSIEFFTNEIRYLYEVEFNRKAIVEESLFSFNPQKALVFNRTTDMESQLSLITLGSKFRLDSSNKKALEVNTLWNNTVFGGFLKTNIDFKELNDVTDWFNKYLKSMVLVNTELDSFVISKMENDALFKQRVLSILKKADTNISDIIVKNAEQIVPDGFYELLKKQALLPEEELEKIRVKGRISTVDLAFEHTVNNEKYTLPFEKESSGTQRYYGLAGLLSLLIHSPCVVPVDELESSLHPDLYQHFLLLFVMNAQKSQLIATTHNREILNNRDIFRNDVIWFTDKGHDCATELFSLADFDSSVIRDTTNVLNVYKSGRIRGTPELGDYHIDSEL